MEGRCSGARRGEADLAPEGEEGPRGASAWRLWADAGCVPLRDWQLLL